MSIMLFFLIFQVSNISCDNLYRYNTDNTVSKQVRILPIQYIQFKYHNSLIDQYAD